MAQTWLTLVGFELSGKVSQDIWYNLSPPPTLRLSREKEELRNVRARSSNIEEISES